MDPHKKGYLTISDWQLLFSKLFKLKNLTLGSFNSQIAYLNEIKSALASYFNSEKDAFT